MSSSSLLPIDVARKMTIAFMEKWSNSRTQYCVGVSRTREDALQVIADHADEPDVSIVLHCEIPHVADSLRNEFVDSQCEKIIGCPIDNSPFLYLYMRRVGTGPPDLSRRVPA